MIKKNYSVQINGLVFNIDEDAYQLLEQFSNEVESKLKDVKGKDYLIQDINQRIVNIFNKKVFFHQERLITKEDVYRGLSYFNYYRPYDKKQKKIYRLNDGRIVFGLCSGLAAYSNLNVWIFRALFLAGSLFYGFGVILYLLLCFLIPKADNALRVLELKGATITIDAIKEKAIEFSEQKKSIIENFFSKYTDFFHYKINFATFNFKFLLRILAGLIISINGILGLVLSFILIKNIGLFPTFIKGSENFLFFSRILFGNSIISLIFLLSLLSIIFIPFLSLFLEAIRYIFSLTFLRGIIKFLKRIIITISFVLFGFCLVYLYVNFLFIDRVEKVYVYPAKNISRVHLYLKNFKSALNYFKDDYQLAYVRTQKGKFIYGKPEFAIVESKTDSLKVRILMQAYGRTSYKAENNVKRLKYDVFYSRDTIFMDSFFTDSRIRFTGQSVKVIFEVPSTKNIVLKPDYYNYFYGDDKKINKNKIIKIAN